jgi:hypothetical protein
MASILTGRAGLRRLLDRHFNALILALVLLLLLEYYIFGGFSYVRKGENIDWSILRHHLVVDHFKNFGLQKWLPETAGGLDIAAIDARSFNAATALFFLFGYRLGYILVLFTSLLLGGIYLKKLLLEHVRLSLLGAGVGVLTYLVYLYFNDVMPLLLGWGILPFILYYLIQGYRSRSPLKYLAPILLGIVYAFFTTVSAANFFLAVVMLPFLLVFYRPVSVRFIVYLGLFYLTNAVLKTPEIRSIKALAAESSRIGVGFYQIDIRGYAGVVREYLGLYCFPILFSGVALLTANPSKLKDSAIKTFAGIFVVILGFQAYGLAFPLLRATIGVYADFPWDRFYILLPFLAAISAGIGADITARDNQLVIRKTSHALRPILIVTYVAFMAWFVLGVKSERLKNWLVANYNFGWTRNADILKLAEKKDELFRAELINDKYGSFVPSIAPLSGIETLGGEVNLMSARYRDFWHLIDRINKNAHTFSLNMESAPQIAPGQFDKHANLTLLGLANVKYILSTYPLQEKDLVQENHPPDTSCSQDEALLKRIDCKFRAVFHGNSAYIYRNERAFPRFFTVSGIKPFDGSKELLQGLESANRSELAAAVYLEKKHVRPEWRLGKGSSDRLQPVEVLNYTPDWIRVRVKADRPSILVAGNNYTKYWRAYEGTTSVEVFPAYHSFWGVYLPEGTHELDFRYER